MKKFLVLLLTIFFFTGCAGQKKVEDSTVKIEYKAYSRGFFQSITVENQVVLVTKSRDEKPSTAALSAADRIGLKKMLQELDLSALPNYKAPTEKRFFDGAAIASLRITKQGKAYESQSFDQGHPPVEIEKIVTKLLSFVK